MTRVVVERATVDDVDALASAWVALADHQRRHGSHLLAAPNRETVREDLSRRVVLDEVLVARFAATTDVDADTDAIETVETDLSPDDLDETALPPSFVGFVSYGREVDGFERDADRGVVQNLYVRSGARSTGVGGALLSAAEDDLRAAGADRVSLEALAANERARAFYRAAGYREHRVELEKRLD